MRAQETLLFVPKSGVNQSTLLVGRPALAAGSSDEAPLEIATAAFGGLFDSRLNMNLRERHGYSYGARAVLDARLGQGPWTAGSAVRADVTGPALQEVFSEIEALPAAPLTAAEIDAGRESLVPSMPALFETVDDLASAAARIYQQNQDPDRYVRLLGSLRGTSPEAIHDAVTRYLEPNLVTVIVAGDPGVARQLPPPALAAKRSVQPTARNLH